MSCQTSVYPKSKKNVFSIPRPSRDIFYAINELEEI